MDTCVALVNSYLRFNGYVATHEQPVLVGEGRPYRYHTATDVDILAVRFPNAAVVVPRSSGCGGADCDDLQLQVDPELDLHDDVVDVIVGEVKQSRPRLNEALREPDVLYATLRRVDPGFDEPLQDTVRKLIRNGEASSESRGRRWRFRLFAFGEGTPVVEAGPFRSMQLSHVALFLIQTMREHHEVWKDAQFGDPVLELLHLFDKMGFSWVANGRVQAAASENQPVTQSGLEERDPEVTKPPVRRTVKPRKAPKLPAEPTFDRPEQSSTEPVRKSSARKRKSRSKQPAKTQLQPRVHRGGRHLKSA